MLRRLLLLLAALSAAAHEGHDAPAGACELSPDDRVVADYRPGIVTVDGHADDWAGVDGYEFPLLPALDPDEDKAYPGGKMSVKALHDGSNVFFMLQVDGEYAYSKGANTKCPSVALMFQVGEKASYHNMGGCADLRDKCTSKSCRGHEVDIMHFSIGNAIPGRLYGSNFIDNKEGNGGDRFGHLVDVYAWNPHCRFLDGLGPSGNSSNAINDWQGAWWHNTITSHSGIGVLARDWKGAFCWGCCKAVRACSTSFGGEMLALKQAMVEIRDRDIKNIIIESDCREMVEWLQNDEVVNSPQGMIKEEFSMICMSALVKLFWVPRGCNLAADEPAKMGKQGYTAFWVGPDHPNLSCGEDSGALTSCEPLVHWLSCLVEDDSPYAKGGTKGTYYFEFSRPLRTMDRFQQDAQFVIGRSSKVAVAFWYPTDGKPWSGSRHYSASCEWLPFDISSPSGTSLSRGGSSGSWDAATAFALLMSVVAFCVSIFVGYWVSTAKSVPFTPINRF